jgi:hypothetical protein
MSWITEAAQLLTAAGVGSLLTQFISRSGERRALRATVREELSIVEELRWAKADEPEAQKRSDDLAAARRRLQNAAMLAHLPRKVIKEYDRLAIVAYTSSRQNLGTQRGVPGVVNECVEAAYQLVSDLLWRPVLTRFTYRWRFRGLQKLVDKNRQTEAGVDLRARIYEV